MKTMTRKELAEEAGVSRRTLNRWFEADPFLRSIPPRRLLRPNEIAYLREKYCILPD
ncbi:MAG: helix-turn-helix transcriptional regulator [Paludibacteraceae bacterium]|nr:helix-turn-helix transcriptional regulator [Paludibacteraceae bacterium]